MDKVYLQEKIKGLKELKEWLLANGTPKLLEKDQDLFSFCITAIVASLPDFEEETATKRLVKDNQICLDVDSIITLMEIAYWTGFRRESL